MNRTRAVDLLTRATANLDGLECVLPSVKVRVHGARLLLQQALLTAPKMGRASDAELALERASAHAVDALRGAVERLPAGGAGRVALEDVLRLLAAAGAAARHARSS